MVVMPSYKFCLSVKEWSMYNGISLYIIYMFSTLTMVHQVTLLCAIL